MLLSLYIMVYHLQYHDISCFSSTHDIDDTDEHIDFMTRSLMSKHLVFPHVPTARGSAPSASCGSFRFRVVVTNLCGHLGHVFRGQALSGFRVTGMCAAIDFPLERRECFSFPHF